MQKILILGLIVLSTTACRYDKEAHMTFGMAASQFVEQRTGSHLQGCAASLGLGLLKEALDATGRGVVDAQDVIATGASCSYTYRW